MIKKIITLFKLGRKLAKSDALVIVSKFIHPPLSVKIIFKILGFSLVREREINKDENEGKDYQTHCNQWEQLLLNLANF